MPDVNYRIIIETKGGQSEKESKGTAPTTKGERVSGNSSGSAYNKKGGGLLSKVATPAIAIKAADVIFTTSINRVALTTGRQTYQQKLDYQYGVAKKSLSFAAAAAASISMGNPLPLIGFVASDALNYTMAIEEKKLSRNLENINIEMANIRSGSFGDRVAKNRP